MSELEKLVARSGMIAWHKYEEGVSSGSVCNDYSGNAKHMSVGSMPIPVIQPTGANGVAPAWYFAGTKNPLTYSGSVTPKHAFVIGGYDGAAMPSGDPGNGGLLSGETSGDILVGNISTTRFYDYDYETTGTYKYRRNDVQYAENDAQIPFGNVGMIEASYDTGWAMDGIQVGQHKNITARKWKGWFAEQILYNRILTDTERFDLYVYFAIKFKLWKKTAAGLNVFPFQPNWSVPMPKEKNVLISTSVAGTAKERVKSAAKRGFDLAFETRDRDEYDTAATFWNQHRGVSSFIYRDDSRSPSEDVTVRFTGSIDLSANNYHDNDYSLQAVEV